MKENDVMIPNLTAEVNSPEPVSKTVELEVTVTLTEKYGRAYICYRVDPNMPVGNQDCVQLREGNKWINNWPVKAHYAEIDTGHVWGSGLNASYWGWDNTKEAWVRVVVTDSTK